MNSWNELQRSPLSIVIKPKDSAGRLALVLGCCFVSRSSACLPPASARTHCGTRELCCFFLDLGWTQSIHCECLFYYRNGTAPGRPVAFGRLLGAAALHMDDVGMSENMSARPFLPYGRRES